MDYCIRWMAVGDKVEAETKKALGLGENDDLEAFYRKDEDAPNHRSRWTCHPPTDLETHIAPRC